MSIPLNLGVSSTVRACLYFMIPRANTFTQQAVKRAFPALVDVALPQDAMVCYDGC